MQGSFARSFSEKISSAVVNSLESYERKKIFRAKRHSFNTDDNHFHLKFVCSISVEYYKYEAQF